MVKTLDDVIEQMADEIAVWGACTGEHSATDRCTGRPCWAAYFKSEILAAVEVDRKLAPNMPAAPEPHPDTTRLDAVIAAGGNWSIQGNAEKGYVVWDQSNGLVAAGRGPTGRAAIDAAKGGA